jgi:hypothetical protein
MRRLTVMAVTPAIFRLAEGKGSGLLDKAERKAPTTFADDGPAGNWYGLALLFGIVPPLQALFQWTMSPTPLVQDDARQFVFWMRRWFDPALFPGDVIADYFQSVTPVGFAALYKGLALVGLDPFLSNRLLPVVLGLILAHFAYRLTFLLAASSGTAFLGSALTSFFIWLVNPVASGTPRAFAVPILLAFLVYLSKSRILGVVIAALLAGLFYPHMALIIGGVLVTCLVVVDPGMRLRLVGHGRTRAICLYGLLAVAGGLAPFAWKAGGESLSKAEALALPSLQPGGRSAFFLDRADWFYLCGERSGLLPVEWGCHSLYGLGSDLAPVLAIGLVLLAVIPSIGLLKRAGWPELDGQSRFVATVPVRLLIVSATGFIAAHLLLFDLHLPSRFGQYPLRAIAFIALAAWGVPKLGKGIGLARLSRRSKQSAALLAAIALLPFPFVPRAEYVEIARPGLYEALAEMPKDTVVAGLVQEADNVPSVAARSVFVSRETLIPWSEAFRKEMQRRMKSLIDAVYATDADRLRRFVRSENIGAIVWETGTFSEAYLNTVWWRTDFPEDHGEAISRIRNNAGFALRELSQDCPDVRRIDGFTVVPATCLQ